MQLLKVTSLEEQKKFVPNQFNLKLLKEKKLCDEDNLLTHRYFVIQSLYSRLLELYLDQKLQISKYDNHLLEHSLQFQEVDDEKKDIYQRNSIFHYFYIRNTLYVEKLNIGDLNYLIHKYNQQNFELDKTSMEMIERTYLNVIKSDIASEEESLISYGPFLNSYFAPTDSLVIGFRYNPYTNQNDLEYNDDVWFENNMKQTSFLNSFFLTMEQNVQEKIPTSISIMQYTDDTVIVENLAMNREEKNSLYRKN